jgi:GNAT superfamily N-acetyltransferase
MPAALIAPAGTDDLPAIRGLMREYAAWLDLDLEYQGFARELADLPGAYAPPDGALVVARIGEEPVGMVALRRRGAERCEMKRLFVRPSARGTGLGRQLAEHIVAVGRTLGYREIVLDTLPVMAGAQKLYLRLGFVDIPPYYASPVPGTRYMGRQL